MVAECSLFSYGWTFQGDVFYGHMLGCDSFLVVCWFLCAEAVIATL